MSDQLKKLQESASRFAWPVIATALVVTGAGAMHEALQAEKAKDLVGAAANLPALLLVTAFAAYAKGVNQLRRDQELGIRNRDGYTRINEDNFAVAEKRRRDLGRQAKIMVPAAAVAVLMPAAPPVAFGVGAVLIGISLATMERETDLLTPLRDAAAKIQKDPQGSTTDELAAARSFLDRQL